MSGILSKTKPNEAQAILNPFIVASAEAYTADDQTAFVETALNCMNMPSLRKKQIAYTSEYVDYLLSVAKVLGTILESSRNPHHVKAAFEIATEAAIHADGSPRAKEARIVWAWIYGSSLAEELATFINAGLTLEMADEALTTAKIEPVFDKQGKESGYQNRNSGFQIMVQDLIAETKTYGKVRPIRPPLNKTHFDMALIS